MEFFSAFVNGKTSGPKVAVYDPSAPPNDPVRRCYDLRNHVLSDPKVSFLLQNIGAMRTTTASPLDVSQLIQCVTGCPAGSALASVQAIPLNPIPAPSRLGPKPGPAGFSASIRVCADYLSDSSLARISSTKNSMDPMLAAQEHITEHTTHELIHLYDVMRLDLGLDSVDCFQLLCLETRAAALSGQCRPSPPLSVQSAISGSTSSSSAFPNTMDEIKPGGFKRCVQASAGRSVVSQSKCADFFKVDPDSPEQQNIDWCIERCLADTAPFPVRP